MSNCAVVRNLEKNGIEIKFNGKPSDETLFKLKEKRFNWSRPGKLWYKTYSESLYEWAKQFCEEGNGSPEIVYSKELSSEPLIRQSSLTKNGKVPKNLLISELNAGKLEYAFFKRFDGMQDMDVYINPSDYEWREGKDFAKEAKWLYESLLTRANTHWSSNIRIERDSESVKSGYISFDDVYFRYKPQYAEKLPSVALVEAEPAMPQSVKYKASLDFLGDLQKGVMTKDEMQEGLKRVQDADDNEFEERLVALSDKLADNKVLVITPKSNNEKQAPIEDIVLTGSKKQAYQVNKDIEAFVSGKELTSSDLKFLNNYTGMGELIEQGAEGKGILYEYFTPYPIVRKMVGLAIKHGFINDGKQKVLEPSCGTGRFLHYINPLSDIVAYEINQTSAQIAQANAPNAHIKKQSYLAAFWERNGKAKDYDKYFDLVIGNPPYGTFVGELTLFEKKVSGAETFVEAFIYRGLKQLKEGGLLVMVIPSAFIDNGEYNRCVKAISQMAELVEAYRLPNGAFDRSDIMTDIIVLKKI